MPEYSTVFYCAGIPLLYVWVLATLTILLLYTLLAPLSTILLMYFNGGLVDFYGEICYNSMSEGYIGLFLFVGAATTFHAFKYKKRSPKYKKDSFQNTKRIHS